MLDAPGKLGGGFGTIVFAVTSASRRSGTGLARRRRREGDIGELRPPTSSATKGRCFWRFVRELGQARVWQVPSRLAGRMSARNGCPQGLARAGEPPVCRDRALARWPGASGEASGQAVPVGQEEGVMLSLRPGREDCLAGGLYGAGRQCTVWVGGSHAC